MIIFAIVVTYNGRQVPYWYDYCFNSLKNSLLQVQTIVIDNASTDDTVDYIEQNFPDVVLIKSEKNIGFGQANNIGIRYALDHNADYVFLLNQDAWIEPNTLSEMVKISQDNPQFGILAPMNLTKEKNNVLPGYMSLLVDTKNIDAISFANDIFFGRLKDIYQAKVINASAWLMPKKTLEIIGGFDPMYFYCGEDDNYLQRMQYHGLKVGLCPKVSIVHDAVIRTVEAKVLLKQDLINERVLIMQASDINDANAYKLIKINAYKRLIKSCILLRKKAIRESFFVIKFLRIHKSTIMNSRKNNVKVGSTWL